jgi:DNA replication and repair protein RecF
MISSIRLQSFRSYSDEAFEFESGVNIIVGPNACGKTSLLEAVLVACRGGSYRVKDVDLVQFNKPWARLNIETDGHSRIIKIHSGAISNKTFEIDGKQYKRLLSNNKLPVVLFEPNHLQLLNGSPDGRRAYMDDFLDQLVPDYGSLLRKYSRTLAQRNSLLKSPSRNKKEELFPWNIRLSQLAGQIVRHRGDLVDRINNTLPETYAELSGGDTKVRANYKPQLETKDYESKHLEKLESSLELDLSSGYTKYGPHRDDFMLDYNDHSAPLFASRGEMRTGVLALKITELEVIESDTGRVPVFLLDDVFSELDGHRRHALTDRLKLGQTFITTTDADIAMKQFAGRCNVVALTSG